MIMFKKKIIDPMEGYLLTPPITASQTKYSITYYEYLRNHGNPFFITLPMADTQVDIATYYTVPDDMVYYITYIQCVTQGIATITPHHIVMGKPTLTNTFINAYIKLLKLASTGSGETLVINPSIPIEVLGGKAIGVQLGGTATSYFGGIIGGFLVPKTFIERII